MFFAHNCKMKIFYSAKNIIQEFSLSLNFIGNFNLFFETHAKMQRRALYIEFQRAAGMEFYKALCCQQLAERFWFLRRKMKQRIRITLVQTNLNLPLHGYNKMSILFSAESNWLFYLWRHFNYLLRPTHWHPLLKRRPEEVRGKASHSKRLDWPLKKKQYYLY